MDAVVSSPRRRVLVQIGGGSQTGKSWLAAELRRSLQAQGVRVVVLEMDDYYLTVGELAAANQPLDFDVPTSVDLDQLEVDVDAVLGGEYVRERRYVFSAGSSGWGVAERRSGGLVGIPGNGALIVEGLYGHYRRLSRPSGIVAFTHDCDDRRRFRRRLERDTGLRGFSAEVVTEIWDRHCSAFAEYIWPGRPGVVADVDFFVADSCR